MSSSPQRILGVDPSLRSTGYAVIEESGDPAQPFRQVVFGTIENHRNLAPSECLAAIHEKLADVIRQHQPTEAAFEAIIYAQNVKTAIVMGHARGAALLACAQSGLRIWEYSPKKVKVGVSGAGGAAK
ncbi:MAG: crossover junction endodeoxyribonuclease RuvC, partial [Verrucomicrobiae bacterium]|nr:crossover junction endodeoxyribonuclease RuvC [Verrucomicrobiae bacterium]